MELGTLVCKACGATVAKVFAEAPRIQALEAPRRDCRHCVLRVTYDPTRGADVTA